MYMTQREQDSLAGHLVISVLILFFDLYKALQLYSWIEIEWFSIDCLK